MTEQEKKHMIDSLSTVQLKDLQTKGFVLIRNAVPASLTDKMFAEYKTAPPPPNKNYPYVRKSRLGRTLGSGLDEFVSHAMKEIARETDIQCDSLFEGYYWPTTPGGGSFNWHQDHETFFMNEECYHYLNFYMVVQKDRPESANLAVLPFDRLEEKNSNLANYVKRKGGIIYWKPEAMKGRLRAVGDYEADSFGTEGLEKLDSSKFLLVARDDMNATVTPINIDFEELKELPHLSVGDMLLMRGDIIHRTGDTNCNRVALSLRCMPRKHAVVDIQNLLTLCTPSDDGIRSKPCSTQKAKMMMNNMQWTWTMAIAAAQGKTQLNFVDHPSIWEESDWSSLSLWQKVKAKWYAYYYFDLLKELSNTGTKFRWQDRFPASS